MITYPQASLVLICLVTAAAPFLAALIVGRIANSALEAMHD